MSEAINKVIRGSRPCTEFTVRITMQDRWIPHFLSMLKYMEQLGNSGCSRQVAIYADGDGDFHPRFKWDESLPFEMEPARDENGDRLYDAG